MERRYQHRRTFTLPSAMGLLVAVIGLAGAGRAQAVTSTTVTVNGNIQAGTCEISAGDINKTVTLQTIKVSDLPASGAAALQNVTLTVDNCDAGLSTATFTFTGTSDTTDALRWKNTGTAQGVAVELESSSGQTIGANGTTNVLAAPIAGGQAVLTFQAGYWHLAGVTATSGSVSAVATVNTSYN